MTCNEDNINDLRHYAELEGTELGDACLLLCDLADMGASYLNDDDLFVQIDKSIKSALDMFKSNTRIVVRTETYTRKIADLEWD